jgi:(S)-2-hydroxyglutarate dehydrogenase
MDAERYTCAVIGGGIVGLAVANAILERWPGTRLILIEKEEECGQHQTGRNSGVLHSGIYYRPGSLKARLCREGGRRLLAFCRKMDVRVEMCGKLIAATQTTELPHLEDLYQRALENGIDAVKLNATEAKEVEPHVSCIAAIHVSSTGIVDFVGVCRGLKEAVRQAGGILKMGAAVNAIQSSEGGHLLETTRGPVKCSFLINCAGLQCDRVAKLGGAKPGARIIPFRGEYYQLKADRCPLVRNLIYPVPDPKFPFLGVHLTRMIDGGIHAGPNAVLSFKREGYTRSAFSWRDFVEIVNYPGFWRFACRHPRMGMREVHRSLSKSAFARSVQRLVPAIRERDLIPAKSGVRAQALRLDGGLVDDFLIVREGSAVHVCNAPSPAATACLEIGRMIADQVPLS